jgi:hypothetical protein
MRGAVPPLPQYGFMTWCLVKHRDNFTFFLFAGEALAGDSYCYFISDGKRDQTGAGVLTELHDRLGLIDPYFRITNPCQAAWACQLITERH